MMKSATLLRGPSTDQGTFGTLHTDDGLLEFDTLELPWRDNHADLSCIPAGTYQCVWHHSPSKGWLYLLTGTEPRTEILVHSANFGGDVEKGWQSQLKGCIALGKVMGKLTNMFGNAQNAVLSSRIACEQFYKWGDEQPVIINITEAAR